MSILEMDNRLRGEKCALALAPSCLAPPPPLCLYSSFFWFSLFLFFFHISSSFSSLLSLRLGGQRSVQTIIRPLYEDKSNRQYKLIRIRVHLTNHLSINQPRQKTDAGETDGQWHKYDTDSACLAPSLLLNFFKRVGELLLTSCKTPLHTLNKVKGPTNNKL